MTRKAGFEVPAAVERRVYEEAVATVYAILLFSGNDKDAFLAICRFVMAFRDAVYGAGEGEPRGGKGTP